MASLALLGTVRAAVPPVEQLLPADTLFVLAVPDSAKLRSLWPQWPYARLWNDPAMKPFREKFLARWQEEFVAPLERELGVKFDAVSRLPQGPLVFAVTQEDWTGRGGAPAWLLLLDARDQSRQLKTLLADLRKQWVDAGKAVPTEKIGGAEFMVVALSSNDVPRGLKRLFPQRQEIQELGKEPEKPIPHGHRLVVGQIESLLIAGTSIKTVTKVMSRLGGGPLPGLADHAAFTADRQAVFRDAPVYLWFNAKPVFDVLAGLPPEKPNPLAPNPLPLPPLQKVVPGAGLAGLVSAALAVRPEVDGVLTELQLNVPEPVRQGVFRLLAAENKDANPPAFVPGDAVKYWRCRLDGPKAVATLEKLISDLSPQTFNTWNYLISNGEEAVKLDEPGYNLRRDLFGNLGDDLIFYQKAPTGKSPEEIESPPALLLIGSPNADALARAMRGALIIRSGDALTPKTREFLGRKIHTIGLPAPSGLRAPPRSLHYAASGGYVAFSTDAATLEEFLRSGESRKKPLRETSGLAEAAQKIGGQNTGWFGYENRAETMRAAFERLRQSGSDATNAATPGPFDLLAGSIPYARPERRIQDWFDYPLLPEYEKVAGHFYFTVYSGRASTGGLGFRFFAPTPPPAIPERVQFR